MVDSPLYTVYHIAAMGNWEEVVQEQLQLLVESGITTNIRITFLGTDTQLEWLQGQLVSYEIDAEVVSVSDNLAHCETLAMIEIERLAKRERVNKPIMYLHTKGVSNPGDWGKQRWRNLMQEHVVRQWRVNLEHLKEHDAVGVNWIEGGKQHFSGTFWIANPEWIRQLPNFIEYHHANGLTRYNCEMWIGAFKWCKAKSLACKNMPFWNGGFDFDAYLPNPIQGHFDYRGMPTYQHKSVLDTIPKFIEEIKPARIFEFGTRHAGFTRLLNDTCRNLKLDCPVMSIDSTHCAEHLTVKQEGVTVLTADIYTNRPVREQVEKFIKEPGLTLIFVDGPNQVKEFAYLSEMAKIGDIVCVHDYCETEDKFRKKFLGKIWNWLEVTHEQLIPTLDRFNMEEVHEELSLSMWGAFKRGEPEPVYSVRPNARIGLGIITYNRPEYFKQITERVLNSSHDVSTILAYNDGSAVKYPDMHLGRISYREGETNLGVAKAKNILLRELLQSGHYYIFIMEDDILIKSPEVFVKYIRATIEGKVEHLNFAHHGPANKGELVGRIGSKIELYKHCVGAFSYYTRNALDKAGLMDENFTNAWEHVEHTARIAECGLTTPFWQFADITGSAELLEEVPGSIDNSSIRPREDWAENVTNGLKYWKTQCKTKVPEGL